MKKQGWRKEPVYNKKKKLKGGTERDWVEADCVEENKLEQVVAWKFGEVQKRVQQTGPASNNARRKNTWDGDAKSRAQGIIRIMETLALQKYEVLNIGNTRSRKESVYRRWRAAQVENTRATCRGVIDKTIPSPAVHKRMTGKCVDVFGGSVFLSLATNHLGLRGHVLDTKFGTLA